MGLTRFGDLNTDLLGDGVWCSTPCFKPKEPVSLSLDTKIGLVGLVGADDDGTLSDGLALPDFFFLFGVQIDRDGAKKRFQCS